MKRKAVLIESSNVTGQTDLPGARLDIENWKNFLKSDLGGAWTDSEIVPLNKPTSSDVDRELKVDSDCYCFVAFSGHGSNGSVLLNEHWTSGYSIALLAPKSNQGTIIVDACRGVNDAIGYDFRTKQAANEIMNKAVALNALKGRATVFASSAEISENMSYGRLLSRSLIDKKAEHRQKWDEALKSSSKGTVEMLACAKGQAAGENPSAGGYYTSLLLDSADVWQRISAASKIYTTKNAHDYAASKLPPQQTPEYKPSWLAFPFAVKT